MAFCPVAHSVAQHLAELDRQDDYDTEIERRVDAILDDPDLDSLREFMTHTENLRLTLNFRALVRPGSDQSVAIAAKEVRQLINEAAGRQASAEHRRECAENRDTAAADAYDRMMESRL